MKRNAKYVASDVAITAIMAALLSVTKLALSFVPNVEPTSFLIILFTVFFGPKTLVAIAVFVLLEGAMYGFGFWWINYIYVWPLLCLVTMLLKKNGNRFTFSLLSGFFGLAFGFLCSFVYAFIGGGFNLSYMISWWIAGIPFDIIHGVANFALMLALYTPVSRVLKIVSAKSRRYKQK